MKHTPPKAVVANAKKGLELLKKPELSNNDIPDVSLKGGKKIASGQQISDDHVRSMANYHAAHMGECPSDAGDSESCDDLLWGGNAGGQWAATRVAAMDATTLSQDEGPELEILLASENPFSIELYTRPETLLDGKIDLAKGEDGLIWAPILRSGTLALRPDPTAPNGRKADPLVFVPGHASKPTEIGLADLKDAFDANAVQHVTIPRTHRNDEFENTGFIEALKIADSTLRPGEKVLMAGHKFLDPEAESKVTAGLIANRSCGILHGYQNTETGVSYPHVIEHVALTNKPWVTGMEAYGTDVFSDGREVTAMMLSDDTSVFIEPREPQKLPKTIFSTADSLEQLERELNLSDIVWSDDDGPSLNQIQSGLWDALDKMGRSPYWDESDVYFDVRDIKPTSALVTMSGLGANDAFVIPFTWDQGQLTLGDFSAWRVVTQAWIADDDAEQDKTEVQSLIDGNSNLSREDAEAIVATYLDVSSKERKAAKKNGDTMPDGSYPVTTQAQADKAWNLRNNSKNFGEAAIVAHIKAMVKKHGLKMPGPAKTNAAIPESDPLKRASMLRMSQEPHTTPGGTSMTLTRDMVMSMQLSDADREVLLAQADEAQRTANENSQFRAAQRDAGKATRLARVKEIFGEDKPGVIAEFDALLSADDGEAAVRLNLADATGVAKPTVLTMTQVVDRILMAFPKADEGEQGKNAKPTLLENPLTGRPDLAPDPAELDGKVEKTGQDLANEWAKALPNGFDLALAPATTTNA